MEPMTFNPESLIGIPHIFDVYRKGNVALLNSPGNGIADDKSIQMAIYEMKSAKRSEAPMRKGIRARDLPAPSGAAVEMEFS